MREFIEKTIKEAGEIAKKYYLQGVKHKIKSSPGDLLTIADLKVEKFLIESILKKFPEHGIISEESAPRNPGAKYVWVIDPIDGTRNFAKKIPFWCNMVGVCKDGKPWIGAIYDPLHDELYYAEKGKGAFLNGKKIKVGKHSTVDHAFMTYSSGIRIKGSPYYAEEYPRYFSFLKKIMDKTGFWLNNFGCNLSICHLAAGNLDAAVLNSGLYHDYLATYVIATEAGAKFTNSYGKDWTRGDMDVVVANPILHKKIIKMFE